MDTHTHTHSYSQKLNKQRLEKEKKSFPGKGTYLGQARLLLGVAWWNPVIP